MKEIAVIAALLAVPLHAAPPPALAPALKPSIEAASQQVFRDINNPQIRNRAYSVELLRQQVQRSINAEIQRQNAAQVHAATSGLQERVHEETIDFLQDLSPEIDRLATESKSPDDFIGRVQGISSQVDSWSRTPPHITADAVKSPAGALLPTASNIEGPFYRPNAPFKTDLIPADDGSGTAMRISGRVFGTDGAAIAGALVDVWQADSAGQYDISDPKDQNNPNIPYKFRGRMRADFEGNYSFVTVLPGNYEIGEGKWRCRHIHFKVSAPGFTPLTTQLYFQGDPYNATDPWWKASTTISIASPGDSLPSGVFDIVLPPAPQK